MKLLILTQRVDKNDDILGFFHRWVEEFARRCEKVTVICLQKGEYDLPKNVKVLSLGKEKLENYKIENSLEIENWKLKIYWRILYAFRFFRYIWKRRQEYNTVFVHMNPEYVVLGGLFWRIWKKKIGLWYVHRQVDLKLRLAEKLADKIFTVSKESFRLKSNKVITTGHGIGTEIFKRNEWAQKIKNSILYVGRIAPIKNVDILIKAANLLNEEGVNFVLNIVGKPGEKDQEYFEKIKNLAKELEEKGKIRFLGKIPNYKLSQVYNQNEILVNLTPSGSFDKTILEAMACELSVLASSKAFKNILPEQLIFKEKDPEDLKDKILNIFKMKEEEKEKLGKNLRELAVQNHSVDRLVEKVVNEFKNVKNKK